jgi:hypothetical protein
MMMRSEEFRLAKNDGPPKTLVAGSAIAADDGALEVQLMERW